MFGLVGDVLFDARISKTMTVTTSRSVPALKKKHVNDKCNGLLSLVESGSTKWWQSYQVMHWHKYNIYVYIYLDLPVWVPNGSVTGCQIYHPLGFNWHPLEGAGTYTCTILYTIYTWRIKHLIILYYIYLWWILLMLKRYRKCLEYQRYEKRNSR